MRINNNIMAMNTHRQYTINTNSVAKSMEKLSSGYRVNRAGDDAAGLAISEKMRAQIRGLKMASKNSSDAISLVQTAEGALQESHNIIQRMRELSVQSASDTNETSIDRAALDAEFQQLIKELDDTAKKTKFNDMGVIDGSYGQIGNVMDNAASKGTAATALIGSTFFSGGEKMGAGAVTVTLSAANGFTFAGTDSTNTAIAANTYKVALTADHTKAGAHTINFGDGSSFTYQLSKDLAPATNDATGWAAALTAEFKAGGVAFAAYDPGKTLTIQTGANQGDELKISLGNMNATALGLKTAAAKPYTIATGAEARDAITITNTALNLISTQRAGLGALQNRLNHKINNLDTSAENLSAAESRIRDLDMAQEMTNFTRNNILTQASTAMLAQANAAPQGVLQLLQ